MALAVGVLWFYGPMSVLFEAPHGSEVILQIRHEKDEEIIFRWCRARAAKFSMRSTPSGTDLPACQTSLPYNPHVARSDRSAAAQSIPIECNDFLKLIGWAGNSNLHLELRRGRVFSMCCLEKRWGGTDQGGVVKKLSSIHRKPTLSRRAISLQLFSTLYETRDPW